MVWRFWSSVFIPGVAMLFFVFCEEGSSIAVPGLIDVKGGAHALPPTVIIHRKLKEKHDDTARSKLANEATKDETEEDYPELDPAPSTKSAIKSGPIVHNTSVVPSIPISASPVHPMKRHP